ncbi:MAG: phosphopantetheine-binding protein [Pseudomonadota bacterium]
MNQRERLEKLNPAQRGLLIEQLRTRKVLKPKQGRWQLVAVVSGCDSHHEPRLNDHLDALLPDYMLPSQWHFVTDLPKNTNGKLDRQALIRLLSSQVDSENVNNPSSDREAVTPDSEPDAQIREIEHILLTVWAEVLFMDVVQLDDDYFELGGDSIASMQIVARAAKQGLEFSTQDIMRFPSIRQLSQRIKTLQINSSDVTLPSTEKDTASVADVMRVLNLGD